MLNGLAYAGVAFLVIMGIVLYQTLIRDSWFWRHGRVVLWHGKNWHYERHSHCDGLGIEWWNPTEGQWTAIPKNLRTNFPSLGNTRKCRCVAGKVVVPDDPDGDTLSDYYDEPPRGGK